MDKAYVMEIPDLKQVLTQEDIAVWELFLLNAEKRYDRILFQISSDDGCFTFENIEACKGILTTVQIDFDNNRVIFNPGDEGNKDFEDFLVEALRQLFIRVNKNRIQFMAAAKKPRTKRLGTRR